MASECIFCHNDAAAKLKVHIKGVGVKYLDVCSTHLCPNSWRDFNQITAHLGLPKTVTISHVKTRKGHSKI